MTKQEYLDWLDFEFEQLDQVIGIKKKKATKK